MGIPATGTVRGHLVTYDYGHEAWRYLDSGIAVPDEPNRKCPKCGEMPTPEGYDMCLGHIPGAIAACCGHGIELGYIMREGGECLSFQKSISPNGEIESESEATNN